MHIHEYQAKGLLEGIRDTHPAGTPCPQPCGSVAGRGGAMPGPVWVVKAQIRAGGRGKGGGVKDPPQPQEEVGEAAASPCSAAVW